VVAGGDGRQHHQPAIRLTRTCTDSLLDLDGIVHAGCSHFDGNRRRYFLDRAQGHNSRNLFRRQQDRHLTDLRRDIFERLQHFSAHREFGGREASNVAARVCQARDEATADRIIHLQENDWERAGLLQNSSYP
jgi:hypothetical protein